MTVGSPLDRAIQRDRTIQDRALEILKSFGPQIGSGSGMQPSHFIQEALRFAEAFTAICEQRELAIQADFEPKPEMKTVAGPVVMVPRPAELAALLPTAASDAVQGGSQTVAK